MFNEIEKELKSSLHYHRKKASVFFMALLFVSIFILVGGLMFGGYLMQLLDKAGTYVLAAQSAGIEIGASSKDTSPDIIKIATENNLGYVMLSGFIIFLFAIAALLKHHINRSSTIEDRLFFIQKAQAITKDSASEQVISALLCKEEIPPPVVISPTAEVIEKISESITSRISSLISK
ncbi:hypothetical protein [Aeromonas dhakensis]|uniref:hypothetical protein n=1 Tax=Aeromonas dhakensis TaxID=196024 RepID=UPI003BA1E7A3